MPAKAGIHGGEGRNWRSGARARARALDPRFRGDDRRHASSVSGPPRWRFRATATPGRPATSLSSPVPSVAEDDMSGEPARTAPIAPTAGRRGRDPGRGINVFKRLREIFRATATPGRPATSLSSLVPSVAGDDAPGEPARIAQTGPTARRRGRNPGRGISVFNGLREIFRATAAPKPGGHARTSS